MVVRLSGATGLRDSKCSDLLSQWMSSPPLIGARFSEARDHAPLPAVHKTKVHAVRTHAEAVFPALYLIVLLLEFGATPSGLCVLCEYITRWGDAYTPRTRLPFPRPIPTRDQFDTMWKSLTAPLALSHPVECADPRRRVVVGPYGRGHIACNPGQPCASPLTGQAPSPLWGGWRVPVRWWHLVAAIDWSIEPRGKGDNTRLPVGRRHGRHGGQGYGCPGPNLG